MRQTGHHESVERVLGSLPHEGCRLTPSSNPIWAPPSRDDRGAGVPSRVRIPTPIVLPQVEIEDPPFAPTMEAYTAAPVRPANRVDLLLNREQIFPAQIDAIRSAQQTFTYGQYVYETGPPIQALLKAMTERGRAGVHGHVLVTDTPPN